MSTFTRRTLVRAAAAGGLGVLANSYGAVGRAGQAVKNTTAPVRAASASVRLTDDNMAGLHSEQKIYNRPWEGEFRANALVLDAEQRICVISLDALNPVMPMTRSAAGRIATATGIPEDNILICATHTHRGLFMGETPGQPWTEFVRRLEEGSVQAAIKAVSAIDAAGPGGQATVQFGQSQEATVGRNSRLLLKDGCIGWDGYEEQDVVRPTGPYDPDLYVLALRRADGKYGGLARCIRQQDARIV